MHAVAGRERRLEPGTKCLILLNGRMLLMSHELIVPALVRGHRRSGLVMDRLRRSGDVQVLKVACPIRGLRVVGYRHTRSRSSEMTMLNICKWRAYQVTRLESREFMVKDAFRVALRAEALWKTSVLKTSAWS